MDLSSSDRRSSVGVGRVLDVTRRGLTAAAAGGLRRAESRGASVSQRGRLEPKAAEQQVGMKDGLVVWNLFYRRHCRAAGQK